MNNRLLLSAVATAALASATALAQNASPPGSNPAPSTTANPPATAANLPANAGQNVPSKGPDFIQVKNDDMLSSNVVGLDVYNKENNDIGKIEDVIILSVGGFLGLGTHYVAVDPGAVTLTPCSPA